jgi:putative transposase
MADIRQDAVHKLSHRLATTISVIGIEDVNVKSMGTNSHLSGSVGDAGMLGCGSLGRKWKTSRRWRAFFYTHERFSPTTKVCSDCGQLDGMPLTNDTMSYNWGVMIECV